MTKQRGRTGKFPVFLVGRFASQVSIECRGHENYSGVPQGSVLGPLSFLGLQSVVG